MQAEFIGEPNNPVALKMGKIFASPAAYPAWIRISSASDKIQSDKIKDVRGFAIKIMGVKGERLQVQNEEKRTQDSILMSHPVMVLGTVKLFHDAVYYSTKWSPILFFFRLVLSGNFCGPDHVVKYSLVPASNLKSSLPPILTDNYLTANIEKHLAANEASFDFMIQVQKDPARMPVEDAGVEWDEKESPFIKVATVRIPPQVFRTREREELAEDLSFSPAHSLTDHRPLGGINRARVQIYRYLSEFRHKQNTRPLVEPDNQLPKEIDHEQR